MSIRLLRACRDGYSTFNSTIKNEDESEFCAIKMKALDEEGTIYLQSPKAIHHVYHSTASGKWELLRHGVGEKDVQGNVLYLAVKDSVWRRRFLIEEITYDGSEGRKFKLDSNRRGSKHFTLFNHDGSVPEKKDEDDAEGDVANDENVAAKITSDGTMHMGYTVSCDKDLPPQLISLSWFLVNLMNRRGNRDGGTHSGVSSAGVF